MSYKDITLIINVHNRHNLLQRNLDYYSHFNINIIVCDSSSNCFPLKNNYKNINYLFYKDASYPWKIREALSIISTPYSVICADDDFIVGKAILECINFLDRNPDYSSVQGHYISFLRTNNKVVYKPMYLDYVGKDISEETPIKRFNQLFKSYIQLLYSVHRTENLKTAFNLASEHLENHNLIELLVAAVGISNGKHKILPVFYSAREILSNSAGTYMMNLSEIKINKDYRAQYVTFINIVSKHISNNCEMNLIQIRRSVINSLEKDYMFGNRNNGILFKIKYLIFQIQFCADFVSKPRVKKIVNHIIKILRNRKIPNASLTTASSISETRNLPGFPFFDIEAKKDLVLIEKLIENSKYYTTPIN